MTVPRPGQRTGAELQGQTTRRRRLTISQVRTLSTERIGKRVARASDEEVARVVEGLSELVGD